MFSEAIYAIVLVSMCYFTLAAPAGQVAERTCRTKGAGTGCMREVADTASSVAL
ncbi:hypothetical protein PILCRDRAFT_812037 [Piloderma croceum F 1598]|uniref:Uncharacterized protein n=1 Tax=Piloderma croceum (strain F 1598) TaxID=765440 RepID=A0A0C3G1V2_PILCF|nr:hypothetical protein PILCRDRAFT_812037 [Piloderma croceum F 1598]